MGARLISHAGSLMNLAKHPASTVQILGAEKALFKVRLGGFNQCCGSEIIIIIIIIFSDPDPTLTLISDPDSDPDPAC